MKNLLAIAIALFLSNLLHAQPANEVDRYSIHRHLFTANAASMAPPIAFQQTTETIQKKNVGLAFLYSLIVPGMGELYVGDYSLGKYFTIGEGVLWITYASFESYGGWLRDDARTFAARHSRFDPAGKSDQFYVDIGNFLNTHEYNEKKLRDREPERLYDPNSSAFWQWDDDQNRQEYRGMRISHDRVFNNARFVAAAIIVNHLASAVNAGRLAVAHNDNINALSSIEVRAGLLDGPIGPDGVRLTLSKKF